MPKFCGFLGFGLVFFFPFFFHLLLLWLLVTSVLPGSMSKSFGASVALVT